MTLQPGYRTLQVLLREPLPGQDLPELVPRRALEGLAGDDEGDEGAADLRDVLEGDGVDDVVGAVLLHALDGGDGVAGLDREAGADADEDAVAVDRAGFGVEGDGVHEGAADEHEDAGEGV